jgi:SOS-response transcriptional repressor LexA
MTTTTWPRWTSQVRYATGPAPGLGGLTPRQWEVLAAIRRLRAPRDLPPTIRELGAEIGVGSPNGVVCHLRALRRKGWVVREACRSRTLRLTAAAEYQMGPGPEDEDEAGGAGRVRAGHGLFGQDKAGKEPNDGAYSC